VSKNVPLWIQDVHLIEKLSYFNREQIPEQAAGAPKAELY
jgi:catalase